MSQERSLDAIEVLRFPLMLLVVFVHVIPPEIHAIKLGWDMASAYTLISEVISHNVGRIAVPCFFLFSGYFFFLKIQTFSIHIYATQLAKRLRTLLIPYLLWIILYVLVALLKNFIFRQLGLANDDMYHYLQSASYYDILWGEPLLYPLWYLRDLICMVVLSPIFYLLFKYTKGLGVLLLIAIYLMVWELNIPGLSTTAFMFFGAGAFMGMYKYDLLVLGAKYKVWKFITAALLLGIATNFNATPYYEYWIRFFILFGVIALLCIGNILVKTNNLKLYLLKLSPSVFFIYAIHLMYIINWLKGAGAKLSLLDNGWGKLIAYFAIPMVCLVICLYIYRFTKKFLPDVLAVLTGGRMIVRPIKEQCT